MTADPALLLTPEPLPTKTFQCEGLEERGQLVGMSVREPGLAARTLTRLSYHALLANAADYIVDRYNVQVVFVPMSGRCSTCSTPTPSSPRCSGRKRRACSPPTTRPAKCSQS